MVSIEGCFLLGRQYKQTDPYYPIQKPETNAVDAYVLPYHDIEVAPARKIKGLWVMDI